MAGFRRAAVCTLPLLALAPGPTNAAPNEACHVLDLDFQPAESPNEPAMRFPLSMVAWLEDANGTFVDTVFVTQQVGTFGLGNRPGRFDFNSGPLWPYGRRRTVFPVWSHRHGLSFPEVDYQNNDDDNLSHPFNESSREVHYCRPLQRTEPSWDAVSCASTVFTDKGVLSTTKTSLYPPRQDLSRAATDAPSVDMYNLLNPFDAVSTATPASGMPAQVSWPIPKGLPLGNYVLFVEVSREFDMNNTYNASTYPSPTGILWKEYGLAYRGQPSVVYKVPFTLANAQTTGMTSAYVGYGDPDGLDGTLRPPDATITTGVPGSGAERLSIKSDGTATYRFRVTSYNEDDTIAPAAVANLEVADVSSSTATISFTAPGDDGLVGRVKGYEVRYLVGDTMTADNFETGSLVNTGVAITDAGQPGQLDLSGLLPETTYSIGIRALDDCRNKGAITTIDVTTLPRPVGQVDACFVATAAYGSIMANDVELLRRFRDVLLHNTALGELAVETYYTFGPPVAGVVGESDLLRATARDVLAPIVAYVSALSFGNAARPGGAGAFDRVKRSHF